MVTTLQGTVSNESGTVQASKIMYVFNQTDNEQHYGAETSDFTNLTTDANGLYTVDLEKFTAVPTTGDVVYVSVYDVTTGKKGIGRIVITASATNTLNITIKDVEPEKTIAHLLRTRIADPNTSRANETQMIIPSESRLDNLVKNSYPRITVELLNEDSKRAGLNSDTRKQDIQVRIGVFIWGKKGDYQKLTMDDGVAREGPLQRAYLVRKVQDVVEERAYVTTPTDRDPMLNDIYNVKIVSRDNVSFDEKDNIMKSFLVVGFSRIRS